MTDLARKIVEEFEKDIPWLTDPDKYSQECEDTMLYLAAKTYLKRYE